MAESTIITGQFVRISQTPASIGERLIALAIDYILLGFYVFSTLALFSRIHLPSDFTMLFFLAIVYLPVLFYAFLCEMFNQGQSLGKRLMNIRVVKADGSTPGIGSYLLRWLLFPIDGPVTGGLGLLVVLLTKNSQRMGDLAAGTMVIKEKNYPFPFPFGTRSFCLQTGHLKKRNNLASACSSRFSIIFSHNGRASLRKHSFSCALLSWLRENTRKMQPNSGR